MDQLLAGFAELDITPSLGSDLAGALFPRPIDGVLDPLFVRAMVLESHGTKLALVSADVLSLSRATVVEVRRLLAERLSIPRGNAAVFATHTHTGPFASPVQGCVPDPSYVARLTDMMVAAVGQALERREPAELGVASALEERISFNRRYVMSDGLVRTHPHRGSHELRRAEGPIDPEVGTVCVRGRDGRVLGYLVNFACHPNVVRGTKVSADFPGALSRALKRRAGEQCVTLFAYGAGGNISHLDVERTDDGDRGAQWAGRMGEVLARRVASAEEAMTFLPSAQLAVASRVLAIRMRDPDTTPYHGTMFADPPTEEVEQLYAAQHAELRRRLEEHPLVDVELQAFRVGNSALLMVPAEWFVELGLALKRQSPLEPTYVVGQANGSVGYVPTLHAFERGGYEVRTGTHSQLVPEAGEQLVEAAGRLVTELARAV